MDDAELNTLFHKAKSGELGDGDVFIASLLVQIDTLKAIRELDDSVRSVSRDIASELSDVQTAIRNR